MSAAQQSGKVIKLQVGTDEFALDELQLAILASSLEESTGLELEMPEELESEEMSAAS